MAENSFRSTHAGQPGSMMAIRVNYSRHSNAFDAPGMDTELGRTRAEVRRWAQGHRLGDKHDWNSSTRDDARMRFPHRPDMHTLSEFQATKLEYNYRAQTLPSVNKDSVYVAKPSKMQVDKTIFLSSAEKAKLSSKCTGTSTRLSRAEMTNDMESAAKEGGWSISTELADDRSSIFKHKTYDDYRAVNKVKGIVDPNTYVSPYQRQQIISESMRSKKIADRQSTQATRERKGLSSGGSDSQQQVFKMSNISEWWDKCPIPELQNNDTMKGASTKENAKSAEGEQMDPNAYDGAEDPH